MVDWQIHPKVGWIQQTTFDLRGWMGLSIGDFRWGDPPSVGFVVEFLMTKAGEWGGPLGLWYISLIQKPYNQYSVEYITRKYHH